MDFIKYRFIYYPVLFIAGVFLVDKIFLIPEVRKNFIQPGGMMYYSQRLLQLGDLEKGLIENRDRKVAVVMGDSRSLALGNIAAWFIGKKDWYLYNFAGPQAVPAYYYFLTEKIFSKRLRPEYLIIGLSPDGFNKNSSYFASPVMSMGVDGRFVEKYKSQILKKDMESYWKTRRYALVGINFSLRTLLKRTFSSIGMDTADKSKEIPVHMFPLVTGFINKSYMGTPERKNEFIKVFLNSPADNLDQYSLQKSPRVKLLKLSDGANYSWFGTMGHTAMKAETKNLVSLYLKFYEVSEVQLYFFRQTLKAANDAGVKVIVFWPRANPYLIEVYKNEPRIYTLWEEIEKISKEEGAVAVDLNSHPGTSCSNFYDASHLSIVCYPGIARTLLEIFEKKQGPG